ncbi:MAG: hypothetical protein AAGC88_10720, partial [Bacteroidota bacterium]
ARQGQEVEGIDQAQVGDVIFYGEEKPESAHIVVETNKVVGIRGFVFREEVDLDELKNINCIRRYIKA